ncbi:hypothetical protein MYCTH_2306830 [Thermothelomyces thermophilus ATCC 42464]|uniref:Altered inheritance of mitochondria protein 21 n=1 Tax=Thermothelomyces thermophilus (strain ATCC 42464 / BCRC 31852 / DSM 1799) TaxID=573729 RepID=G2QEW3_THET4|nr:uncharacterized protein MYCTH_2306830 [Thermothelomyces thermophilus ATCC 42464]AEO58992.1 hypothetical protein MYCTH_2306830 [Thermothelomyces thermophilus ATCC 42464]
MSAATANTPPIPPRPSRSPEKGPTPTIPPRPATRRFQRSTSPNPDRFAPSPLNEPSFLASPKTSQVGTYNGHESDPVHHRSTSVELPSLGEEGQEYAALAEEINSSKEGSTSPEHTRTVAEDLKLHAPKPSLPASSAKQRVMTVTRTDSERAAAFGIGRASSAEDSIPGVPSNRSLKKKASTASQLSGTDREFDEEHGIPAIGLQVPMYKNAGDVQAPSPAPSAEGAKGGNHTRRTSAHGNLPPGSYGLHGHGVVPQDKLEKAYYEKHPDLLKKEHLPHHYDRPNDFSMSREDLNKIVRETASRGSGLGVKDYAGTPSDQVGWQALEESASRIASPEPKRASIHVDEPNCRRSVMFSDTESNVDEVERPYATPILADDEVAKDPSSLSQQPAVEPHTSESEGPSSRPTSRPASLHKETSYELRSTPLEDVEEYEPLFKDDEKEEAEKPATEEQPKNTHNHPHRFPSADIWEDAPSSTLYTAEVSTPELFDEQEEPSRAAVPPPREGETPVQAFARYQEELAEKEAHGERAAHKPSWVEHQKQHLVAETSAARPAMQHRFPSRDVWEDVPESLQLETTVSTAQQDDAPPSPSPVEAPKPEVLERAPAKPKSPEAPSPAEKPPIPNRPKPRQPSTDDKPAVPSRPKPQIPARPVKAGPPSGGLEPAEAATPPRQKPAVPARPMGSKIAALQAGFMNDLNRRLQLGPQAPPSKKEEPAGSGAAKEDGQAEAKERAPLSDARKGRARGPQRRAPAAAAAAKAAATASPEAKPAATFTFVSATTFFEIDPDEGVLNTGGAAKEEVSEPEAKPTAETDAGKVKAEEPRAEQKPGEVEAETASGTSPPAEEGEAKAQDIVEAEVEPRKAPAPQEEREPEEAKPEPEPNTKTETEAQETKSLASNLAGETLIKEEVKKNEEHGDVEAAKAVEI